MPINYQPLILHKVLVMIIELAHTLGQVLDQTRPLHLLLQEPPVHPICLCCLSSWLLGSVLNSNNDIKCKQIAHNTIMLHKTRVQE